MNPGGALPASEQGCEEGRTGLALFLWSAGQDEEVAPEEPIERRREVQEFPALQTGVNPEGTQHEFLEAAPDPEVGAGADLVRL